MKSDPQFPAALRTDQNSMRKPPETLETW